MRVSGDIPRDIGHEPVAAPESPSISSPPSSSSIKSKLVIPIFRFLLFLLSGVTDGWTGIGPSMTEIACNAAVVRYYLQVSKILPHLGMGDGRICIEGEPVERLVTGVAMFKVDFLLPPFNTYGVTRSVGII